MNIVPGDGPNAVHDGSHAMATQLGPNERKRQYQYLHTLLLKQKRHSYRVCG